MNPTLARNGERDEGLLADVKVVNSMVSHNLFERSRSCLESLDLSDLDCNVLLL
jgi:hypothetical protein